MTQPFVAEIRVMPYTFAPSGWASCNGQLLPISQNTALFSLLGTNYGGDGRSTFALPNLQGHMAMGTGQGPGLSDRQLAESVGQASVALTANELPAHGHTLRAGASGLAASPANAALAPPATGASAYRMPGATVAMAGDSLGASGDGLPHENRPPALGLMFCIALQGIFPPRS